MKPEPIPDDCLPFGGDEKKMLDLLRGPKLDAAGKVIDGVWAGKTPAEILAERDSYNRACGE